ncbi:MAG: GrdX family protein [Synergistaceae bacterium]|nr:GrdX family protein [Synergistaceae bacterium]MBR0094918.1 GrdX family protein [Synergistaceae bacterium]
MLFKLVTNNMNLYNAVKCGEFVDGSSLDVLVHVRGLVHLGSKILTHPLCGNLRPNHQPFRSVIIEEKKGFVDLDSLSLIEDAVRVYQSCALIMPDAIDEATRGDYAYIDAELMKESLEQYRLLRRDLL